MTELAESLKLCLDQTLHVVITASDPLHSTRDPSVVHFCLSTAKHACTCLSAKPHASKQSSLRNAAVFEGTAASRQCIGQEMPARLVTSILQEMHHDELTVSVTSAQGLASENSLCHSPKFALPNEATATELGSQHTQWHIKWHSNHPPHAVPGRICLHISGTSKYLHLVGTQLQSHMAVLHAKRIGCLTRKLSIA